MSRTRYFITRTVQTIVLFFVIMTLLFWFFRLMPGDYVAMLAFEGADPETLEAVRDKWGLNDPWYVQYWRFLTNLATGDAGTSIQFRRPVLEIVGIRIFNSFILVAPAMTFAYGLGVVLGTLMGTKRGSVLEKYGNMTVLTLGTIPSFFTGIMLIIIFSAWLDIFPVSGMFTPGFTSELAEGAPWWRRYFTSNFGWHYALPFTAIVLRYLYLPTLTMRTNVVEVLGQDFIDYHRMTGLSDSKILRHIGKHSILPVITIYPISMTASLGGLVLIETVFNWPGIGHTLVQAVLSRDIPTVQFVFFIIAAFILTANFVVDVLYGVIDPRISLGDR